VAVHACPFFGTSDVELLTGEHHFFSEFK